MFDIYQENAPTFFPENETAGPIEQRRFRYLMFFMIVILRGSQYSAMLIPKTSFLTILSRIVSKIRGIIVCFTKNGWINPQLLRCRLEVIDQPFKRTSYPPLIGPINPLLLVAMMVTFFARFNLRGLFYLLRLPSCNLTHHRHAVLPTSV